MEQSARLNPPILIKIPEVSFKVNMIILSNLHNISSQQKKLRGVIILMMSRYKGHQRDISKLNKLDTYQ